MLPNFPVNSKVCAHNWERWEAKEERLGKREEGKTAEETDISLLTKGPPALCIPFSSLQMESQSSWTPLPSLLKCLLLLPGECYTLAWSQDCQLP